MKRKVGSAVFSVWPSTISANIFGQMCSLYKQACLTIEQRWKQNFGLQFPYWPCLWWCLHDSAPSSLTTALQWYHWYSLATKALQCSFLIHKERILSPYNFSACLAMTNVILAQWDILCWGLTLNEKEGENKVEVRPSEFLLMYKSPWIRFRKAFEVPQYDLYSIFKQSCYKTLEELCQFWFPGKI